MLGQIMEWFYRDLAGLGTDSAAPGFKHVIIRPQPIGDITWAQAAYESPRGRVATAWRREAGGFTLEVTIPPGATATVHVPCAEGATVYEGDGRVPAAQRPGLRRLGREVGVEIWAAASGRYTFSVRDEG
jgi:alpha-L-rhamnosidase